MSLIYKGARFFQLAIPFSWIYIEACFVELTLQKGFHYGTIVAGVPYDGELTLPSLLRQVFMEAVHRILNSFQKMGCFVAQIFVKSSNFHAKKATGL